MKKTVILSTVLISTALTSLPLAASAQDTTAVNNSGDSAIVTTNRRSFNDLDPLSFADIKKTINPMLMDMPSVRGVLASNDGDDTIIIVAARNMTVSLKGLRDRLNTRGTDRQSEYDKFYKAIKSNIQNSDPFNENNIKVIIRTTAALDDFEKLTALDGVPNFILRKPFVDNLEMVVVADTKTSIAFMPIGRLKDLNMTSDEAFAKAIANFAASNKEIKTKDENGLSYVSGEAGYVPSLLLTDNFSNAMKAKYPQGYVVAIPNREMLVVAPIGDDAAISKLKEISNSNDKGNYALSNKIYIKSEANTWTAIDLAK